MVRIEQAMTQAPQRSSSEHRILVINPGSTSTKIAVYLNEEMVFQEKISYDGDQLAQFEGILDQYQMRLDGIFEALERHGESLSGLAAVVTRGGVMKPVESGVYEVNEEMIRDLIGTGRVRHVSNLAAPIAREIADAAGVRAYIADAVVVDELCPLARLSGLPEIPRRANFHALNHKAVARRAARDIGKRYEDVNFIVAHLGGGVTVGAHQKGKVVDVNNGLEGEGPFAPERAGALPTLEVVELCYSGMYSKEEIVKKLIGGGGLMAHLGTNSAAEVERRIDAGDQYAALVYETMAYRIAREIGACAVTLSGEVDAVIITGGMAHSRRLVRWITSRVQHIAPVMLYPGENEMEALAAACLRILRGEEKTKVYT